MEGLSPRRAGSLQDDHAGSRRVYSPVPDARAPEALPPHSPLRSIRQWCARRQHYAGLLAPEYGASRRSATLHQYRRSGALTSLPVLRRAHVHHRDVRARNHTSHSAVDTHPCGRLRQLMITVDTLAATSPVLVAGYRPAPPTYARFINTTGGFSTDLHCCMRAALVHPPRPSLPARSATALPPINQH